MDVGVREYPRPRHTILALQKECRHRDAGNGQIQIDIGHDDHRAFAAQFQRDFFQIAHSTLDDRAACPGRSGEGNLVDVIMGCQRRAGVGTQAVDNIDDACGETGVDHHLAECERG